jgi:hypothetical protein
LFPAILFDPADRRSAFYVLLHTQSLTRSENTPLHQADFFAEGMDVMRVTKGGLIATVRVYCPRANGAQRQKGKQNGP